MHTIAKSHGKKQIKQCRFGNKCKNAECAFAHPIKNILDIIDQRAEVMYVNPKKITQRLTESEFIENTLHCQYISELFDCIVYTRRSDDNPYEIESYPHLGIFATWDEAYDALAMYIHSDESTNAESRKIRFAEDDFSLFVEDPGENNTGEK